MDLIDPHQRGGLRRIENVITNVAGRWTTRLWIAPCKSHPPDCRKKSISLKWAPFCAWAKSVRAVRDLKALYPHKIVLADAKLPMPVKSSPYVFRSQRGLGNGHLLCGYPAPQARWMAKSLTAMCARSRQAGYWTQNRRSSGAMRASASGFITAAVTRAGRRRGVGRADITAIKRLWAGGTS